ncbi:MAG: tRNA lysidine(34) synthetase TilS [Paracoccus sp. (in: a-proteobacteria)]|nr:tRNA lysidine(34) synthetase TilS [Paracoccus sp. (in: a-proteobacteria)]
MPTDPARIPAAGFAALDLLAGDLDGLGIALSGGGDSVALMYLVAEWAQARGKRVAAATVDHGLREASGAEAVAAGDAARALGLDHAILHWDDAGTGTGNLMDRARRARLRLLGDWARAQGQPAVVLGHNRDDIAETFLMRAARGAGLDGLAAMSPRRMADGMLWLRPLLDFGRAELRLWLAGRGIGWIDEPSNENPRFARARIRRAMADLGLDPTALARSASHLAQARDALNAGLGPVIGGMRAHLGSLRIGRADWAALPPEQRRRVILAGVAFVTGRDYPPRAPGSDHALAGLAAGRRVTLDGAVLDPGPDLLIHREAAAAARAPAAGPVWDNRWQISGLAPGDRLRPLGADVARFDWRGAGLTHLEAQALPGVERGPALLCPVLAPHDGLAARALRDKITWVESRLGIEPRP